MNLRKIFYDEKNLQLYYQSNTKEMNQQNRIAIDITIQRKNLL